MKFMTEVICFTAGLLFYFSCNPGQDSLKNTANQHLDRPLFPYLDKNGCYGYVTGEMDSVLEAKYRTATAFTTTGFAVVSALKAKARNIYGVINRKGELVLPYAYDAIEMKVMAGQTLVWTRHAYRNRLRFWNWRGVLFGDNLLSGAKLIDTEVWRSKIRLSVLETGQLIRSQRSYDRAPLFESLPFEGLDSLHFLQGDRLYRLRDGRADCIAKKIYGKTSSGHLLQKRGGVYRLITFGGQPWGDAKYKKRTHLRIRLEDREVRFPIKDIAKLPSENGNASLRYVFEDNRGAQFLFPDLEEPFPLRVDVMAGEILSMEAVLRQARLYTGPFGSGRYYFLWNYLKDRRRVFATDRTGRWQRFPSSTFNPATRKQPDASSIVPDVELPQGWRLEDHKAVGGGIYCIKIVKGERGIMDQKMGLWSETKGSWVWNPVNYAIYPLDPDKIYWKYQRDKTGKYGLYNASAFREITGPEFNEVFKNGFVRVGRSVAGEIEFFVDWKKPKAYCDPSYFKFSPPVHL